jgi:hypothetical protein
MEALERVKMLEKKRPRAGDTLVARGLSGWLACMQGDYYSRRKVTPEPLQRIGAYHEVDWQAAVAAFHAARHRATDRRASNPTNVQRGDAVTY